MIANNSANCTFLSSSEFDWLIASLGYFEPAPVVAVAVSGGADSMALLLLANDWAKAKNGKVVALTVNHNLRSEAAAEALQVRKWCEYLGIDQYTLCWQPPSPIHTSIQENARNARYELMLEWCRENNILHLLTAHHLDDHVETMFFRLARGSGLDGLSAISAQRIVEGVRLLRPLLKIPKARLITTLKKRNQEWLEDPSNHNSSYARVHIRQQLAQIDNNIDIKKRSVIIAEQFGKFRNILENKLVSQITNCVSVFSKGYATINIQEFNNLDGEISLKALASLIRTLSGSDHPPRTSQLQSLKQLIKNNELNSKYSIGGLLFEAVKGNIILVYREYNAISPPIVVEPDMSVLWDKRFVIKISSDTKNTHIRVQALGSRGLVEVRKNAKHLLKNMPPDRIIRTFPSLWSLEELLCVPHIVYMNEKIRVFSTMPDIQFHPAKPLADSCFSVMNS
ncbi:MAG: tRNA lysidine(34) synthetase TilS [Pseudomonadota bacterium]